MALKILHVVNISFVLPYYIGDQFDYFHSLGFNIFVACSPSKHFDSYSKEKNFTPFELEIKREISILSDIKSIILLRRFIIQNKIDFVIGHTPKGAMIAMIASYLAGVKNRIYFRHGIFYQTSKGMKRYLLKSIEKLTSKIATKIVCVSDSVVKISTQDNLNEFNKNIVLNIGTCNGINTKKFSKENLNEDTLNLLRHKYKIESSDRIIGYVGRLVQDKGIKQLIDAWKVLLITNDNIKLLLVGPFELRDSIDEDVKEYILNEPSIIHTGLISDVLPLYGLMNIFILPSFREGFPTVVLEASSMELPIITTKATGCIDSIIENVTGVFCEVDHICISSKINFYLNNPHAAIEHGINGRKFVVDNFQQEIIWREIENKIFNLTL
jgi:glycosyltransferase involved in cell wall biosynthesis